MTTLNAPSTISNERVDARAARLTEAIAMRIREAMGGMTQDALAKRLGYSSGSTVSAHLNGRTNLTLKTVVRYTVALDADIVSVPDVKRPQKRRRRRGGKRTVSTERKALADIDPVKRKLHDLLTDLTARIGQIIEADDELSQRELARRMERDEAYVSRGLAGGINFTLKTIAAFEEALGESILHVVGQEHVDCQEQHASSSPYQKGLFVRLKTSNDGGYCFDMPGVVTGAMDHYVDPENQTESVEENLVAA